MNELQKVNLERAREEIYSIETAMRYFKAEIEYRALRTHWNTILASYPKAVSFLRRASDAGPTKGWSDRMLSEQRTDAILNYMHKARDHDTHGNSFPSTPVAPSASLEFIAKAQGNAIFRFADCTVTSKDDAGKPITRKLDGLFEVEQGKAIRTPVGFVAKETDRHLKLEAVTDRAKNVYEVPKVDCPEEEIAEFFATTVLDWLKGKLKELEARLGQV